MKCRPSGTRRGETSRRSSNRDSLAPHFQQRQPAHRLRPPVARNGHHGHYAGGALACHGGLSFWTSIASISTARSRWPTIWHCRTSSEPTLWMGISFPLKYPVPAILLIKSIVMSLAVTIAVIAMAYPMATSSLSAVQRQQGPVAVLRPFRSGRAISCGSSPGRSVLGFNGAINSA